MMGLYILDENHNPVPEPYYLLWGRWFEHIDNRRVAYDEIGEVIVSTVFIGTDHITVPGGEPAFFESMVFGGLLDQEQARYSTWDEALAGHQAMVDRVRQAEGEKR